MPPTVGPLCVWVTVTKTSSGFPPIPVATTLRIFCASRRGVKHRSRLIRVVRRLPWVTTIARAASGAVIFRAARLRYGP